nr:hypothetical protein [Burkholderia lata]
MRFVRLFWEQLALNMLRQGEVGLPNNGIVSRLMARLRRLSPLFVLAVVIPTLASTVYYGVIASDVYVSEARFIVRSPERQQQSSLFSALLQGTGFSRAQDDTYAVHDFILSRDALAELNKSDYLVSAFGASRADFFNRFPGLDRDRSFEALYKYYQRHVQVDYDTASSITTLQVRAYSAEEANHIAESLLEMSEGLVNKLNERARRDLIGSAQREEAAAEQRAKSAAVALSKYRDSATVFDPERQSLLQLQQVTGLQNALQEAEAQLQQLRTLTPKNPQIPALELRIKSLRDSIGQSVANVSSGKSSLSGKASQYAMLQLEQTFAERQLASAMAALENARNEADRKQLYLERLVQPNLPDIAIEPKRLRSIVVVFVLGMIAWGILSLLLAGVREHHD